MPTAAPPSHPKSKPLEAAERYEAWYHSRRGNWIGRNEFALLRTLLPRTCTNLLDVGCGSGFFSRQLAANGFVVTGLDADPAMVAYAGRQDPHSRYVVGDATRLPFADHAFDCLTAVTSLCFIADQADALEEMLRVTRRRIVLGLLNRHSLLYWQKGRHGGTGAYAGAHWHDAQEIRAQLAGLGVHKIELRTAIQWPAGHRLSRALERITPSCSPFGAFLAVAFNPL